MSATGEREETDAFTHVGLSFKRVMVAFRRLRGRETHRPGELSYAQFGLLGALADGDALPTGELALAADLSPATVTEMLEALTTAGLVARARSQQDKRIVLTSLTERGRALVAERHARWEPRWRAALAGFSDTDLLTAAAVLDRVAEMLDAEPSTEST
jgi:DNA-binding MarR family transcriptional regulator